MHELSKTIFCRLRIRNNVCPFVLMQSSRAAGALRQYSNGMLSFGMLAWRMNAGFGTKRIQTTTAVHELYDLRSTWIGDWIRSHAWQITSFGAHLGRYDS